MLVSGPETDTVALRGKTPTKIITQAFLVHLSITHNPSVSVCCCLIFLCVCGWSFLLPQPPPLMSSLFFSFSVPTAVFDRGVQPIKDKTHHVWRGRQWRRRRRQHFQCGLILACFALRAAAACPRSHCLWERFTL